MSPPTLMLRSWPSMLSPLSPLCCTVCTLCAVLGDWGSEAARDVGETASIPSKRGDPKPMLPLVPYTAPDCRAESGEAGLGNAAASAAAAASEGSAAALSTATCGGIAKREGFSRQLLVADTGPASAYAAQAYSMKLCMFCRCKLGRTCALCFRAKVRKTSSPSCPSRRLLSAWVVVRLQAVGQEQHSGQTVQTGRADNTASMPDHAKRPFPKAADVQLPNRQHTNSSKAAPPVERVFVCH